MMRRVPRLRRAVLYLGEGSNFTQNTVLFSNAFQVEYQIGHGYNFQTLRGKRVAAGGKTREQTHDFEGSEQRLGIDTIDSEEDYFSYQFNYDISVAIIEEETDQVELAFLDSVKEIKKEIFCLHALRKDMQIEGRSYEVH